MMALSEPIGERGKSGDTVNGKSGLLKGPFQSRLTALTRVDSVGRVEEEMKCRGEKVKQIN
jgi:hypothetical protein